MFLKAGFLLAKFFERSDNFEGTKKMCEIQKKVKNKMAAFNARQLLLLRNNQLRLLLLRRRQKRSSKYKKRFWIRRVYAQRRQKGEFHMLVRELSFYDQEYFFQCFRMSPTLFEELFSWIPPQLQKQTTKM